MRTILVHSSSSEPLGNRHLVNIDQIVDVFEYNGKTAIVTVLDLNDDHLLAVEESLIEVAIKIVNANLEPPYTGIEELAELTKKGE